MDIKLEREGERERGREREREGEKESIPLLFLALDPGILAMEENEEWMTTVLGTNCSLNRRVHGSKQAPDNGFPG